MTQMTYRELGRALKEMFEEAGDPDVVGKTVEAVEWDRQSQDDCENAAFVLISDKVDEAKDGVRELLVEFFRANDPNFNEGEFVGSTYGA